ncbi:MAG: cell division ATP-binding protein FtsE [Thermodesulfobacteriota bacterium]
MSHVYKVFPSQIEALSDVNLEISDGEFTYIHGASSSGRTTLIRILYGAEKPTRGEVMVNGMKITEKGFNKIHLLRRSMGIVFQDFKLLRDRTVSENISFALEVTAYRKQEIQKRVSEVLEKVGLQQRAKDPVLALSAGEQQRVAIARALINDPPLLLADEPTENLDDPMTDEVMRIFTDLNQKGTTIILATHNKELIQRYPHRVIYLRGGRVDFKTEDEQKAEE